jgi:hypothetical protein
MDSLLLANQVCLFYFILAYFILPRESLGFLFDQSSCSRHLLHESNQRPKIANKGAEFVNM